MRIPATRQAATWHLVGIAERLAGAWVVPLYAGHAVVLSQYADRAAFVHEHRALAFDAPLRPPAGACVPHIRRSHAALAVCQTERALGLPLRLYVVGGLWQPAFWSGQAAAIGSRRVRIAALVHALRCAHLGRRHPRRLGLDRHRHVLVAIADDAGLHGFVGGAGYALALWSNRNGLRRCRTAQGLQGVVFRFEPGKFRGVGASCPCRLDLASQVIHLLLRGASALNHNAGVGGGQFGSVGAALSFSVAKLLTTFAGSDRAVQSVDI